MKDKVLMLAILISVVLVSGCTTDNSDEYEIIISDGSVIDPKICTDKGIADKVVIFHSPTCPACLKTVPVLEDLEDEVTTEFMFIDVSSETEKMKELGIAPTHIPTVVIDCKAHTGYKEKDTFRSLIEGN